MNFYFVRHGESEANVAGIFSNRGYVHGLTEKGRVQVHDTGKRLKDIKFDYVVSSPLKRAVQTTEILMEYINMSYSINSALNEIDMGDLEGETIALHLPLFFDLLDQWLIQNKLAERAPEGESLLDVKRRFFPLIDELRVAREPEDNILLVGHGTMYCCALPFLLKNVQPEFAKTHFPRNAQYIVATSDGENLYCKSWGDINL